MSLMEACGTSEHSLCENRDGAAEKTNDLHLFEALKVSQPLDGSWKIR